MNSRKSIVIFVVQVFGLIMGVITTKIILSVLPPQEYGLFGYAYGLSGLFFRWNDFGIPL